MVGSDPTIRNGKPAPDPYLATIQRFEQPPTVSKNVLVFEDSVCGVISASAAGATTVMVPEKEIFRKIVVEYEDTLEKNVDEIIFSIEHFVPENYGLPKWM